MSTPGRESLTTARRVYRVSWRTESKIVVASSPRQAIGMAVPEWDTGPLSGLTVEELVPRPAISENEWFKGVSGRVRDGEDGYVCLPLGDWELVSDCWSMGEALLRRYKEALSLIAGMPTSERNPDGDEQAAHSMQAVAQEALDG